MNECVSSLSQSELLKRISELLGEHSSSCRHLQNVLSKISLDHQSLCDFSMIELQKLDKISQQLDDLSNVLSVCSSNSDNQPVAFSRAIERATKLSETRARIFNQNTAPTNSGDLDLL